ncbi:MULTISPECIES: hypothetical protein [Enterobacteriaceae]|nr:MULTISPECIES: hypothetical protein [Enterobacteriaceae]MDU1922798.1 hypothetical protein [Enterobacter sp.]
MKDNTKIYKINTTLPGIMQAAAYPQQQRGFVQEMLNKNLWPSNIEPGITGNVVCIE